MLSNPLIRFLLDGRSAPFGDRPRHSAAVLQTLIGGIDNGIHFLGSDVALNNLKGLIRGKSLLDKNNVHKKATNQVTSGFAGIVE
jgi:hypothetical protein